MEDLEDVGADEDDLDFLQQFFQDPAVLQMVDVSQGSFSSL